MRLSKQGATIFALSFEIVGLIIAGAYVGKEADKIYHLKGLGTAGGVIIALILWFVHVIHAVKLMQDEEAKSNEDKQQ
ncbi:MAG: hypothetical protein VX583_03085 [Bdellovibrionota bacterium]|nr:hypothetical protein [Pseudobdellovibrionaceae bacterium]